MSWWEPICGFEPPFERYYQPGLYLLYARNTDANYIREGSYSLKITPSSTTHADTGDISIGMDLSAYPDPFICFSFYIADRSKVGAGGYFGINFYDRNRDVMYGNFPYAGMANGWNHAKIRLSEFTDYTSRKAQDIVTFSFRLKVSDKSQPFYVDDVYVSCDGEKGTEAGFDYRVAWYERYNTPNDRNQWYVSDLYPMSLTYSRSLNEIGQTTLTLPADISLPQFYDNIRIYRNGRCVFSGVVIRRSRKQGFCTVTVRENAWILKRIYSISSFSYGWIADFDLFNALYGLVRAGDAIGIGLFSPRGFGIPLTVPAGYNSFVIPDGTTITKDEFVHPWVLLRDYQERHAFDFEMSPNYVPRFWSKQGKTIEGTFYEDVDFKLLSDEESAEDVCTACRAHSRGGDMAWSYDYEDATAEALYGRLVNAKDVDAKSQAEVQLAATNEVTALKAPSRTLEIEPIASSFLGRLADIGDTMILRVRDAGVTVRLYGYTVTVDENGEKLSGVKIQ